MIEFLLNLDENIFLFFNQIHAPFWDAAMYMFSGRFIWVPMYVAIFIGFLKGFPPRVAMIWVVAVALTIVLCDQTCATYIRPYFERLRPSNLENPLSEFVHVVREYRGGRYGFPSCHAANSFGLATILALVWPGTRLRYGIFIWAFINSYSRIYLGVHYPGDLLVGGIIGVIFGFIVYAAARAVIRRMTAADPGRMYPRQYMLRLNDYIIPYKSIDLSVVTGVITVICILLIAID